MPAKPTYEELEQRIRTLEESERRLKKNKADLEIKRNFRTLFEHSPVGITKFDADGKTLYANLSFQRFLGYTEQELCGRHFKEWTHPEDIKPSLDLARRFLEGEINQETIERRYVRKDGLVIWGRVAVSAVRSRSSDVDYFIAMVEDYTDQKRIEDLSTITHGLLLSMSRKRELPNVLEKCLDAALQASGMDCGGIYLMDEAGGLKLEHAAGLSEKFINPARYYPPDAANTRLVTAGKPVYSRHADLGVAITGEDRGESLKAFAALPIFAEDHLVGCMNVASHRVEEVPLNSRPFLEKIVCVAGLLIENARAESMLRQSEEKFRSIFENSMDGIMFTSPDGSIYAANPAACRMLGRTEKELCDSGRKVVLDEGDPRVLKALDEREKTGVFMGELSQKKKDGSTFPAEISSAVFKSDRGFTRACVIFRDITKLKKMERELISRERKYRTLVESLPDFVVRYDLDLRRIYVNPAWEKASGLSAAEVINKSVADTPRVAVSASREYEQKLRQALDTGISQHIEFSWENAGGKKLFLDYIILPEYDCDGKISGLLSVGRDLTRQARLKKELEASAGMLGSVYESLDEAIFVVDSDSGNIIAANAAAERMLGYRIEEMIGRNTEFLHVNRKMYREFDRMLLTCLPAEGMFRTEFSMCRKDGTVFPTDHTVKEVFDSLGNRKILISVVRDISEREKARRALSNREKALKETNLRLQELNTALKVLLDHREKEKNSLEERFTESISELFLPYLQKFRKTGLTDIQKEYMSILESNLKEIVKPYKHRYFEKLAHLTPAETHIVSNIKQGFSTKEIADKLNLSARTVEFHRDNIRKKLGIKKRNINLKSYLNSLS